MLAQSDTVQADTFDTLPHTIADCLSSLPALVGVPRTEADTERRLRQSVAFYRVYGPWHPQEEWFLLRYDATRDVLLVLHRFGRDDRKSELKCVHPSYFTTLRGPRGEWVRMDESFQAASVKTLLR